eukprot:2666875-Pyramimonas_sp.AAC.1
MWCCARLVLEPSCHAALRSPCQAEYFRGQLASSVARGFSVRQLARPPPSAVRSSPRRLTGHSGGR